MRRRELLVALAAAATGGAAGYSAGRVQELSTGATTASASTPAERALANRTPTPESTPTPEPTPTPTPTPEPTPTPTPTATPWPIPTAAVGEPFEVGEGSHRLRYTVNDFWRADQVGRFDGLSAQGVYVVVDLTVENLGGRERTVPLREMILRGGVRKYPDGEVTNAAEHDDRLDGVSLANTVLFPDEPVRGIAVYDTPDDPDHEHYLRFEPIDGGGLAHAVPLARLGDFPRLE